METHKQFVMNGDRYVYDFGMCTTGKGYAQLDTYQDAFYYGIWANPAKLQIVTYAEGDFTIKDAADSGEFVAEIRELVKWHNEFGSSADGRKGFHGIDPGFNVALKRRFVALGLADLLH